MSLTQLLKTAARSAVGVAAGLALTFVAVDSAFAQAPAAPTITPATGQGPALWLIEDADSRIWLFGTVHVLRPNTPWGTAKVEAALAEADTLILEIKDPNDQAAVAPLIQQFGVSPDRPLSSLLTPEELAELNAAASALGANAAALDPLRPWLAGLTIAVAPIIAAGFDPTSGVDTVLRAQALAAGKPVGELEGAEAQVRMLASMSEETQLAFLRSALRDYERASTMLDELVQAWATGDVEAIDRIGVEEMRNQSQELYDLILANRNRDWADQIQTMLAGSGDTFIAVGAAHLAGDDSVQEILEDRGVRAARVQ